MAQVRDAHQRAVGALAGGQEAEVGRHHVFRVFEDVQDGRAEDRGVEPRARQPALARLDRDAAVQAHERTDLRVASGEEQRGATAEAIADDAEEARVHGRDGAKAIREKGEIPGLGCGHPEDVGIALHHVTEANRRRARGHDIALARQVLAQERVIGDGSSVSLSDEHQGEAARGRLRVAPGFHGSEEPGQGGRSAAPPETPGNVGSPGSSPRPARPSGLRACARSRSRARSLRRTWPRTRGARAPDTKGRSGWGGEWSPRAGDGSGRTRSGRGIRPRGLPASGGPRAETLAATLPPSRRERGRAGSPGRSGTGTRRTPFVEDDAPLAVRLAAPHGVERPDPLALRVVHGPRAQGELS